MSALVGNVRGQETGVMNTSQRVVIIGGGILGVSTGAQLAERGVATTLVSQAGLASGASGRSLAWLNSAHPRSKVYHDLRMAGIDRYRSWAERVPGASSYLRFTGGLTWAGPGESFRQRYERQRAIGYETRWLTADEVAASVPGVDPRSVAEEGAIFNADEGWVELPALIHDLASRMTEVGGVIRSETGPAEPRIDHDRVVGVTLASGELVDADTVLLATGPAIPRQLAHIGRDLPDGSSAAMIVHTKPTPTPLRSVLNTPRVSVRPMINSGLAIDSAWSTAELHIAEDGTITAPASTVPRLLDAAQDVLTGDQELEVDRVRVGWKPIPEGDEPVLGPVDGIEGLQVGFTHSGATLGLIIGELLADAIAGQPDAEILNTFGFGRFG